MKQTMEMVNMLLRMGTEHYMRCRYVMFAVSRGCPETETFFDELFRFTDRKRPMLIGMKEGDA